MAALHRGPIILLVQQRPYVAVLDRAAKRKQLIVLSSDPMANEVRVVGRVCFSARVVVSHGGSFDTVAQLCSVDGFGRSEME